MGIDVINNKYPNQWILIINPDIDRYGEITSAVVIAAGDKRKSVCDAIKNLEGGAIVRYTGQIPEGAVCLL